MDAYENGQTHLERQTRNDSGAHISRKRGEIHVDGCGVGNGWSKFPEDIWEPQSPSLIPSPQNNFFLVWKATYNFTRYWQIIQREKIVHTVILTKTNKELFFIFWNFLLHSLGCSHWLLLAALSSESCKFVQTSSLWVARLSAARAAAARLLVTFATNLPILYPTAVPPMPPPLTPESSHKKKGVQTISLREKHREEGK